jgi:SAM-dependent methyltransferase
MTVQDHKARMVLLVVFAVLIYSCGEKSTQANQQHVFQEDIADNYLEDSLLVQDQFSLDLNVGDESERGTWQNPELVIRKIGDLRNKVVADIGSGTGYFTFPISRNARKVLAIDIEQRYLDYIEDRKLELPIEQADVIETRLTVEDEPNLHTDEVDAVLLVNVFYYLEDRTNYMTIVNNALKDNGVLVLVDLTDQVVDILKVSGFKDIEVDEESLQYQYIITAK